MHYSMFISLYSSGKKMVKNADKTVLSNGFRGVYTRDKLLPGGRGAPI